MVKAKNLCKGSQFVNKARSWCCTLIWIVSIEIMETRCDYIIFICQASQTREGLIILINALFNFTNGITENICRTIASIVRAYWVGSTSATIKSRLVNEMTLLIGMFLRFFMISNSMQSIKSSICLSSAARIEMFVMRRNK